MESFPKEAELQERGGNKVKYTLKGSESPICIIVTSAIMNKKGRRGEK